jgi:hypothetical protein
MQLPTIPKFGRLSRKHKITAAGAAAAAAVVLTVTGLQATGGSSAVAEGDPTGYSVSTGDKVKSLDAKSGMASQKAISDQIAAKKKAAADAAAKKKAAAEAAAKKKAAAEAAAKKKAAAEAAKKRAAAEAAKRARERAAANRSKHRAALARAAAAAKAKAKAAPAPTVTYANNLDGWIRESLAVMAKHNIPGSYNGIYRNIIRESSGNPNAINLWDSNAAAGIPSKGLLQVINPTFQAYHVNGTSWNIYDPVANITAACNYAYHVYGSMDNVNGPY